MNKTNTWLCSGWLLLGVLLLVSVEATMAQPFTFTYVETEFPAINYGSLDYADVDADGDLDLVVAGNANRFQPFLPTSFVAMSEGEEIISSGSSVLWRHNYNEMALPQQLWHTETSWADYDADGDLDFVMMGTAQPEAPFEASTVMYRKDGTSFQVADVGLPALYGGAAEWADYDNDGDPDLLLTGSTSDEQFESHLFRNDGGVFTDVDTDLRNVAFGDAAWGDYDADGDLDLLLSGADNTGAFFTEVYRNDAGTLTNSGASLEGLAFTSLDWGDYDNDGDLDILLTGGELSPFVLDGVVKIYRNESGGFLEVDTNLDGIVYGTSAWGDYDNDGDLDILVIGGRQALGTQFGRVYQNQGGGRFVQTVTLSGASLATALWGDYDGDGDLDIIVSGLSSNGNPLTNLYRNDHRLVNTPPFAPSGLQANAEGGSVTLNWERATDEQTTAAGLSYNLRVGTSPGSANVVAPMSSLETGERWVPAPGNVGSSARWRLNLEPGTYYWSVQAVDHAFKGSAFSEEGTFTISGKSDDSATDAEDSTLPTRIALHANFPNPFREATTLAYDLPAPTQVDMTIYNILGAEVRHLVSQTQPAGQQQVVWDGTDEAGRRVSAGVYFVRLEVGGSAWSQKLMLLN